MSVTFKAIRPRVWQGRYSRVVGKESVFHLSNYRGRLWPVITWYVDDMMLVCATEECEAVRNLANAVAAGKHYLGGVGTGSFQINEFGQVIVPASDGSGQRAIVGEVSGNLRFNNPDTGKMFDLSGTGLKSGDSWLLPYIGMKYQLHAASRIYFYRYDDTGGYSEYANPQDEGLISTLRSIRRTGPMRFIVNLCGVILTRRPPAGGWVQEERWEPVYVGRINFSKWFQKEE